MTDLAERLLCGNIDIVQNMCDSFQADFTPLMYATYYGHSGLVRTLCESKCDINLQGSVSTFDLQCFRFRLHFETD